MGVPPTPKGKGRTTSNTCETRLDLKFIAEVIARIGKKIKSRKGDKKERGGGVEERERKISLQDGTKFVVSPMACQHPFESCQSS